MGQQSNEAIVHVGSIVPILANLKPDSQKIVLEGFKLAHINRKLSIRGEVWMIADLFLNEEDPSKIMAKLVKADPSISDGTVAKWFKADAE